MQPGWFVLAGSSLSRRAARLAPLIAIALSAELVLGVALLAGPFARTSAPTTATTVAPERDVPPGLPRLAAPGLWTGAVAASALRTRADGTLQVPARETQLGFWAGGVRPGEPGAAVVVGHADLDGRLGVFTRLDEATPGMRVMVQTGTSTQVFRIVSVTRYRKDVFPTAVVYRPSATPVLRLVTCGGLYDRRSGQYRDNVVVQAVPG